MPFELPWKKKNTPLYQENKRVFKASRRNNISGQTGNTTQKMSYIQLWEDAVHLSCCRLMLHLVPRKEVQPKKSAWAWNGKKQELLKKYFKTYFQCFAPSWWQNLKKTSQQCWLLGCLRLDGNLQIEIPKNHENKKHFSFIVQYLPWKVHASS